MGQFTRGYHPKPMGYDGTMVKQRSAQLRMARMASTHFVEALFGVQFLPRKMAVNGDRNWRSPSNPPFSHGNPVNNDITGP
jgi:hypothetical protein